MRTIKFRAWLEGTHDDMTITDPYMDYDVVIKDGYYASVESGWDIQGTYSTIPLMQFTGLHDKNGKEIYEGDILKDSLGRRKIVEYYKDGFWLNASIDGAEWNLRFTHKTSEIIGNIHKNPELLKKHP